MHVKTRGCIVSVRGRSAIDINIEGDLEMLFVMPEGLGDAPWDAKGVPFPGHFGSLLLILLTHISFHSTIIFISSVWVCFALIFNRCVCLSEGQPVLYCRELHFSLWSVPLIISYGSKLWPEPGRPVSWVKAILYLYMFLQGVCKHFYLQYQQHVAIYALLGYGCSARRRRRWSRQKSPAYAC